MGWEIEVLPNGQKKRVFKDEPLPEQKPVAVEEAATEEITEKPARKPRIVARGGKKS